MQIPQQFSVSIGSFKLERESLLVGEKITLKLWCLRILAIEKLEFGKKGNMTLILVLEREECDVRGFCNLKTALSTIEGL